MDLFEPIRRGYRALGFGADEDVRAMLDQTGPEPACWEVRGVGLWGRSRPADGVAALELFRGLPAHFELVRVQVTTWAPNKRLTRLAVGGRFRVRVRGTWEVLEVPFDHVWSFAGGRVQSVHNVLDGFELRRLPPAYSCAV
jgi:hypothetical protein